MEINAIHILGFAPRKIPTDSDKIRQAKAERQLHLKNPPKLPKKFTFALAAMIFAAIAIYQTAGNKYGGRKFLAVLAIAGVSFAAAGLTEVISDVFDLGAGAAGAAGAVIWTIVMLCCIRIVLRRVSRE